MMYKFIIDMFKDIKNNSVIYAHNMARFDGVLIYKLLLNSRKIKDA